MGCLRMTSSQDGDPVKLLEQLLRALPSSAESEQSQTRRLLSSFANGEISRDQVVAQLLLLYCTGFGGAIRALGTLSKEAARELDEQVRIENDSSLRRQTASSSRGKVSHQKREAIERFKNKSSSVLQREFVLFKALTNTDREIPLAELVARASKFDKEINPAALTAHLDRLTKDGLVVRERKGLYRHAAHSKQYLDALTAEIEARNLELPDA